MKRTFSVAFVCLALVAAVFLCGCTSTDDGAAPGGETTPTAAPTAAPAEEVQVEIKEYLVV